jgi:alkylation response protein AidB-like acyl-CoA dehydrogenase
MFTKKVARLRDRAREAAKVLRREAGKIDEEDLFPPALLDLLWESGMMTLWAPRELGGESAGLPEMAVAVEELARGCGAAGLAVLLQVLGLAALVAGSKPEQTKERIARIVDRRLTCAFALSEPEPLPGEKAKMTTARKIKSEFHISGKKTFVSGGREADLAIVFAVTKPKAGLKSALTAFLVPAGTPGMLPGREMPRAGLRGLPAVELWFEGCRVKSDSLLGKTGQGYAIAQKAMITAAPLAAALACGLLMEAIDYTLAMVRERDPKASPLSEFQPLELTLADMAAAMDSSLALTWVAAGEVQDGIPDGERLAREAKWLATEAAANAIESAARLFGVEGSLKGSVLERLARDAHACQIVLGPNHIHRIEVARKLIAGR